MRRKPFGGTGVELPIIGQGTWDIPESGVRLAEAKRALRRGIELGMVHLDTAEMYGGGRVEEILGEAIAGIDRESLFITSKVMPGNATFQGTIAACEASLRRLGTEYVDLYLLHWPGSQPLVDTMRALETLVEQGKTRYVGVSNFDIDLLREARSHLHRTPLACNQVLYHLRERGVEHRILPYCKSENVAIVGYTPFGRGRFPSAKSAGSDLLVRIAKERRATPRQVILAFLTRDPALFAIPKASRIEHAEENAGAGDCALTVDDIAQIDAAFPIGDDGPLASL